MNKKRIDAKTIRLKAEAARAEAETKSAEELKVYKRKQRAAVVIAKQLLNAACNGKKCAPLDPNSYLDHIDLLTANGYSIVGVGYVRRKYLDLQIVAQTHKAALAKAINDSQELQDFLWANQWTKTAVETNMGILLKLLNSTHAAWSKDEFPRSRVYFTNFLWAKKHYKNGVGSIPNRGLFETLESVWCEYLLYDSATSNAKLLNADLKAIGEKASDSEIYAVWHEKKSTDEDFTDLMPTARFLKWVAEPDGQELLNGVDKKISEAAEEGKTEIDISFSKRGKKTYWFIGDENLPGPSAAILSKIISLRSFKLRIRSPKGVTISW